MWYFAHENDDLTVYYGSAPLLPWHQGLQLGVTSFQCCCRDLNGAVSAAGNPVSGLHFHSIDARMLCLQRDLPWELNSSLQTMGRTDLDGTVGAVGKPNFGSHFRVFVEDDGSKRLVGTSFDEDLRQGKLTFFEFNDQMELLYRTTA